MACDRAPRRRSHTKTTEWVVEVEIQDPLPVTAAELDAVERYFADIVAQALIVSRPPTETSSVNRVRPLRVKNENGCGGTSIAPKGSATLRATKRNIGGSREP